MKDVEMRLFLLLLVNILIHRYIDLFCIMELTRTSRNIRSKGTVMMPYLTELRLYILVIESKERGEIILSRRIILDALLLALTAGIIIVKAVYEMDVASPNGWGVG